MTDDDQPRRGGTATYIEDADGNRTLVSSSPEHAGDAPVEPPVHLPLEQVVERAAKAKEPRK